MITKESDNRETPAWIKSIFEDWFDPCPLNPSPEVDGLTLDWKDKTFLNPPYSSPTPWIYKAIEENKKGKMVAILLRFDPTTKYFRALMENKAHIFYCGERLKFINPFVEKNYSSPFPSILIILSKDNEVSK